MNTFFHFGLNGPMAEEFITNPTKVESSFYLMKYELGSLGALLYFSPYFAIIIKTVFNRKHYPYFVPAAVSIAILTSYIFLPNVQTFEVPFYCFLFMGLYENPSVKQLYTDQSENICHLSVKELIKTCLGTVKRIPLLLLQFFPRSKNIYIFGAWAGQKFSDNSRSLFLYALAHTNKKCLWICKNKQVYTQMKQAGLPVLMAYSLKGLYYQLRAGVAFSCVGDGDFCRQMLGGCVHVELWHGVGGCKKIGMDDREYRENALSPRVRFYSRLEEWPLRKHYFIYTSEETKKVFKSAFLVSDHMFIHGGQPRNDMFFDKDYQPQTISHAEFGGKKVIVYMPTHRKTGQVKMDMSNLLDLEALNTFCQENNVVFLIKKHFYHGSETENLDAYPNIIDITSRPVDSNELLLAADYLISDYSSCTGDYLLLDRPVFFYCFDYADYISQDREMYWDFESVTPGDHCMTFEELLESLRRTIAGKTDPYAAERERVRDMYYDRESQCISSGKILAQVEQILSK